MTRKRSFSSAVLDVCRRARRGSTRGQPRLEIDQRRLDLVADRRRRDARRSCSRRQVGKAVVEDRARAHAGSSDRSIGGAEIDRVDQRVEIDADLAAELRLGDRARGRGAARRDHALAGLVAQVERRSCASRFSMRLAKREHQRRRSRFVAGIRPSTVTPPTRQKEAAGFIGEAGARRTIASRRLVLRRLAGLRDRRAERAACRPAACTRT